MKTFWLFLFSICSISLFSTTVDTIKTTTSITDVTVFFNGAQITRSGDLNLPIGKHIIMIEGLPLELNAQSIQVSQVENCQILSVKHLVKSGKNKSDIKEISDIENQIKLTELKMKEIINQISVFDIEEKLLLDNSRFGKKDEGSTVDEIRQAADFYRLRLNGIRQAKLNLVSDYDSYKEDIQKLYSNANELNTKINKPYSVILIALENKSVVKTKLSFKYYTPSAGWDPLYDFRVENIDKPLAIVFNAEVYQSSGEDWKNVNIRLSTSNPALSGSKPELNTWYVERGLVSYNQDQYAGSGTGTLTGNVYDSKSGEPLPFCNVAIYKGKELISGVATDFDGNYIIKPLKAGNYNIEASYIGFTSQMKSNAMIYPNQTTYQDFNLIGNDKLAEIEVVNYRNAAMLGGAVGYDREEYDDISFRSNMNQPKGASEKSKKDITTTEYISNTIVNPVVNLEYVIDIPYSIPSDGHNYSMKIKEVSFPVNYIYHVVPKIEKDAFLTAEIIDWNDLNLLSGKAGIYYQGTFTGESFIDVNTTSDTLNISLGRDNSIVVSREGDKMINDKKFIGSTVKETIGWNISIKNNKNAKIKVFVYDQFPISERKTIEVERLESSGAKIEERTGKLSWEINMEPNEKKEIKIAYSVKYPKAEYIIVE